MVWGTDTWGGETVIDSRKNLQASVGRYLRVKFRTNSTDTPFTLNGYELYAQIMGMR